MNIFNKVLFLTVLLPLLSTPMIAAEPFAMRGGEGGARMEGHFDDQRASTMGNHPYQSDRSIDRRNFGRENYPNWKDNRELNNWNNLNSYPDGIVEPIVDPYDVNNYNQGYAPYMNSSQGQGSSSAPQGQ